MQTKILWIGLVLALTSSSHVNAQYAKEDSTFRKHFIGSTMFMLGNLSSVNRPDFVQLNYGYRITVNDVISLELKTWKYSWPLGVPFGKSFQTSEEKFPGYIREFGFAIAYKRYFRKGLYAGVHVMNAWQTFVNENGNKIDNGFQIFNTFRIGYHVKLYKDIIFLEPSLAITHRPYHTKMPDEFKQIDDRWSKLFS